MKRYKVKDQIKSDLKAMGYGPRMVRVTEEAVGYDTSITMTIKKPFVSLEELTKIKRQYEYVRIDEHTYEILAGGNVFIKIVFDEDYLEEISSKYSGEVDYLLERTEKENSFEVRPGYLLQNRGRGLVIQKASDFTSGMKIYPEDLASWIARYDYNR